MTDEQRKQTAAERCAELANKGSSGWNSQHFTSDEFSPVFRAFRRYVETIDARDRGVLALLERANAADWVHSVMRSKELLRADLLPEPKPSLLEEFLQSQGAALEKDCPYHAGARDALDWIAKRGENSNVGS